MQFNKTLSYLFVALLSLSLLTGCGNGSSKKTPAVENNSSEEAELIESSSTEVLNQAPVVNAGNDKTVQINEMLTITGTASDNDGTIVSYEWKKGNSVLATTLSFSYVPTVVGTDVLTLTVTDNDGAIATDTVNVLVKAVTNNVSTDDYSNTKSNAQEIDLNTEITGDIELSNDVDYFKFVLTEQTTVAFERQSVTGNIGQENLARFKVYDGNGVELLDDYLSRFSKKQILTLDSGNYYIEISPVSNDLTGYVFRLNTSNSISTDDYSNTKSNAQEVDLNTEITGDIELSNDVDYFKFVLTEQTTVAFERQSVTGNIGQENLARFKVYDGNGVELLDDYLSRFSKKQILTLDSGNYYIEISPVSNDLTGYVFRLNTN